MNLAELKEAYKARKLALDSAKKEEEKYKALLKDAMLEAGESDYTDEAGYRFERIVQERKSMDEEKPRRLTKSKLCCPNCKLSLSPLMSWSEKARSGRERCVCAKSTISTCGSGWLATRWRMVSSWYFFSMQW